MDRWLKQQPLNRKSFSSIAAVSTETTKTFTSKVRADSDFEYDIHIRLLTIKNLRRLGDVIRIIICVLDSRGVVMKRTEN